MAVNLKISVIKKTKLETTYSVPCKVVKLGLDVMPAPVLAMLSEEGISVAEVSKLAAKPDLAGVILAVEHHVTGDKIVIELD